jgi:hypothetical protein
MLLDPEAWRSLGFRLYGHAGDRPTTVLARGVCARVLRVDARFRNVKPTWKTAGSFQVDYQGHLSDPRSVPLNSKKFWVMPDLVPYSIVWSPYQGLPLGRVQLWGYTAPLTAFDLYRLSQLDSMGLYNPSDTGSPEFPDLISSTANVLRHSVSTIPVELLPENADRTNASFYNSSSVPMRLKCGAIAASTPLNTVAYTAVLQPKGFYELPVSYIGSIWAVWDRVDPNGFVQVTEFVRVVESATN